MNTSAEGIVGFAPYFANNNFANESLFYRLLNTTNINAKFAIWRVGSTARIEFDGFESSLIKGNSALTYLKT